MKPGDIIFLSASVPSREGWREDARPAEIEEAIVSLARAVFARGGRLLFGGHPSISPLISSVAGEYFKPDEARTVRPVITFQSEFFKGGLPDETWLLYRMGWSSIEWTGKRPAGGEPDREASLRWMREWMLLGPDLPQEVRMRNELAAPKAMVAIGGMEGVIDEARMFLEHARYWDGGERSKIYALASGGGAAARLLFTDDGELRAAKKGGRIVDLERLWLERHRGAVRAPFVPYASIVQYMLDNLRG